MKTVAALALTLALVLLSLPALATDFERKAVTIDGSTFVERSSDPTPGEAGGFDVIEHAGATADSWRPLTSLYFGSETDLATSVIDCESGGNPYADNPNSSAAGLFQMMGSWYNGTWWGYTFDPFDPEANVYYAKQLRDASGWSNWNPSRYCWG